MINQDVSVVVGRNPLDPSDHHRFESPALLSIAEVVQQHNIRFVLPTVCALNTPDNLIPQSEWVEQRLTAGDTLLFLPLLQGGGGGGSNPLKIILGLALIVFAAPLAGMLGGIGAGIGAAGFIKFGAAMLLSAFVPAPKLPSMGGGLGDVKQASPNYSISSQGNALGLEQPIPCIYGNHKTYPPLIAQPWMEYINNSQHLYQVFVIGHGRYSALTAATVMIEDSPIASFSQVFWQQQYYDAHGNMSVIAQHNGIAGAAHVSWHHLITNSVEVSGQELKAANEARDNDGWVGPFVLNKAGTAVSTIRLDKSCPRGLYYANDDGSFASKTVEWNDQARKIDDNGAPIGGWFSLNQSETISDTASVTVSANTTAMVTLTIDTNQTNTRNFRVDNAAASPSGDLLTDFWGRFGGILGGSLVRAGIHSVTVDTSGATDVITVMFQPVFVGHDDYGEPIYAYSVRLTFDYTTTRVTSTPSVTGVTNDAVNFSRSIAVAAGRYEVRSRRIDNKDINARAGHELRWVGLSGVLTGTPLYRDMTLLYVRMEATDKISQQASRKVNAVVQRLLPRYNAATGRWSDPEATRNPVWAAVDIAKAGYGGGLPDTRLDLASLAAMAAVCDSRGDRFDYVAEQGATILEALAMCGRSFRAVPRISSGTVAFVRDQTRTAAMMAFSMNQMIAGSLSLRYVLPNERSSGRIEVEYYDRQVWAWRKVLCGSGDSLEQPHKVRFEGVTERAQAIREGGYLSMVNRYRRVFVTFSTDMEGMIPGYGDLIRIAHELPNWGQSAHAIGWDVVTRTLTVSMPLEWPSGQAYAVLRNKDGSPSAQYPVARGAAADEVVFASLPYPLPYVGDDYEKTTVLFGGSEQAVVIGVKPRGLDRVEITAVLDDSRVYVA